jgi:hypothetical protein
LARSKASDFFIYIFLIHFAKIYDRFKIYQFWPPTAVARRHGGTAVGVQQPPR